MPQSWFWPFLAVFLGGGLGATCRWLLNLKFNPAGPAFQTGTWLANMAGGLLIGLALALLAARPHWPPEIRLFVITGILGGLTTFSTFSAEVVGFLERGQFGLALMTAAGNLLGSLALTAVGLAVGRLWLFHE